MKYGKKGANYAKVKPGTDQAKDGTSYVGNDYKKGEANLKVNKA